MLSSNLEIRHRSTFTSNENLVTSLTRLSFPDIKIKEVVHRGVPSPTSEDKEVSLYRVGVLPYFSCDGV